MPPPHHPVWSHPKSSNLTTDKEWYLTGERRSFLAILFLFLLFPSELSSFLLCIPDIAFSNSCMFLYTIPIVLQIKHMPFVQMQRIRLICYSVNNNDKGVNLWDNLGMSTENGFCKNSSCNYLLHFFLQLPFIISYKISEAITGLIYTRNRWNQNEDFQKEKEKCAVLSNVLVYLIIWLGLPEHWRNYMHACFLVQQGGHIDTSHVILICW